MKKVIISILLLLCSGMSIAGKIITIDKRAQALNSSWITTNPEDVYKIFNPNKIKIKLLLFIYE